MWLINLLDWNSQNIWKPCPLLPKCDSFDETASWNPEGAWESLTYVFNYKDIPFSKLHIARWITVCYLHEHPLVKFVTIRPKSTGRYRLAFTLCLQHIPWPFFYILLVCGVFPIFSPNWIPNRYRIFDLECTVSDGWYYYCRYVFLPVWSLTQ